MNNANTDTTTSNTIRDNFDKFLRAIRYTFRSGNVLYWGLFAIILCIIARDDSERTAGIARIFNTYGVSPNCHPDTSNACHDAWQQIGQEYPPHYDMMLLFFSAFYLFLCKMFDGVRRLFEGLEEKPVPYEPASLITFLLPLKFHIGILLLLAVSLLLLPLGSSFWLIGTLTIFCFFTPAMMMSLIGNNSILGMIYPGNWLLILKNLGMTNYLCLVFIPFLLACLLNHFVAFLERILGNPPLTLGIASLIAAFTLALSILYIGYFTCEKVQAGLSEEEKRVLYDADTYRMDDDEKKQFAQDLLATELLIREGGFAQAETLLLNYTSVYRDIGQYFPAYRALYEFYQIHRRYEALPALEQRLIEAAMYGNERCYRCVRKAVENIALDDIARLPADWIKPLSHMAFDHHDYRSVLALTRNFAQRHPGHKDILENYYFAARALDKSGETEQALHLLQDLITHYPEHPKTTQIRRSYEKLQQQMTHDQP